MPQTMILLDGESLTLDELAAIAGEGVAVGIAPAARERMRRSRAVVESIAAGDRSVYAVNTGVGQLAAVRIPAADLEQLQSNVVRSHACGVGEPLAREEVRAMMAIRANVLAKGLSGIRPVVAERLCDLLNQGITPVVPSRGSVGASGDLAPLAHVALVLTGEGWADLDGKRLTGGEALARRGLAPVRLAAKEGVSLINGTQAMLAVGALEWRKARALAESADVLCALTLDALRGTPAAFDARIHAARPHPGQARSARAMERLLEASQIRASHAGCGRLQDAYSLRCAPQVHGAVHDTLAEAARVFAIELNSATDNPLVFGEEVVSGGNFHGQVLALELDYLAIALATLAGISERRIDRLVNPLVNEDLPAFLARDPGLESGLMMTQATAASLVAENRVLATPATPGSMTTSGNKEDFVSMGMTAALKLRQVVLNTSLVLAVEALCAERALGFLAPLRSSAALESVRAGIRERAGEGIADRPLTAAIESLAAWLLGGGLAAAARGS